MLPNKCKCGWLPSIVYNRDVVWGSTTDIYVLCENCGRKGDIKHTLDEAIENWEERRIQND